MIFVSRRSVQSIFALMAMLILLGACYSTQATVLPYIDLEERSPLPAVDADVRPLRLAVGAILSPQGNIDSYQEFAEYLELKLGRSVEIIQRRTYAETNELIRRNEADLAFVCTSAYLDGHDEFGMELLVAPEIDGESVYHSQVIVAADSDIDAIGDLRDVSFAFTDPMSFSGRVYPTSLVRAQGHNPEDFFADTVFTYSHDRAIEAVEIGIVDAAAVDSLVLHYAIERDSDLASKLRIIHTSPPFAIPPIVVPPGLSDRERLLWQDILLGMDEDPTGLKILADLGIDRFVLIEDSAYDSARTLVAHTGYLP